MPKLITQLSFRNFETRGILAKSESQLMLITKTMGKNSAGALTVITGTPSLKDANWAYGVVRILGGIKYCR